MTDHQARVYAGRLVDGEFCDTFLIWSGPYSLAIGVLWALEDELPSMDFYWNSDRPA